MAVETLSEWQYRQRLALPYEVKVRWAEQRIRQWYNHWAGMVYVAYSGGQDSQTLLHIVRAMYPEVPAVFCHEPTFREVLDVVRATENVVWLKPRMNIKAIIDRWGYPIISKQVSGHVGKARSAGPGSATWVLRTTGRTTYGKRSPRSKIPAKWMKLLTAPFKVSDHCCDIIKKQPSAAYGRETGRYGMIGTRASEGRRRELAYKRTGCNAFDLRQPRSTPLAIWSADDVQRYISENGIKVATVYGMGYTRTGCMACGFGAHLRNPNQFQLLYDTHPKVWNWAMDTLGWRPVLAWLGIPAVPPPMFAMK